MKLLIVFSLAFVATIAFDLRKVEIPSRSIIVPVKKNEGRITNGNNALKEQFPYQVGLLLKMSFNRTSWCGGCLIDKQWVLTAAHCTQGTKSITVYLGSTVRNNPKLTFTVSRDDIIIHSGWSMITLKNDISLIKIPAVSLSSAIATVKLPSLASSYSDLAGDYAIASGWGKFSDDDNNLSNDLQWARLQVITNSRCQETFGSVVTSSHICVATPGGVSPCNGDSGGPLVLESNKVLIGLTSFGSSDGCAKGHPGVFTRLTSHLDWIQSKTGIAY